MAKILGIIIVVLACSGIGINASNKLKTYRNNCRQLIELMNTICVMIRYRNMNFYEISRELKTQKGLGELEFVQHLPTEYNGITTFKQEWENSLLSDSGIGDDEKELLATLSSELGTSDAEGQISAFELTASQLKVIEKKRREDYARKGKLYRSIGVLAGIMVGIVAI